jgi:OOP family OmpA-OmpF porin
VKVLAIAVLLAATPLAGCAEPIDRPSCEWLSTTAAPVDAGATVILLDRSGSTAGPGGPDYAAALTKVVTAAVDSHDVVHIGTFDGSAASVRWTAEGLTTDRGRTNPELREDDDETAKRCVREELTAASAVVASAPGSDIMGALAVGGQTVRGAGGPRKVVVATDGLATTGCAALTDVPVGDAAVTGRISALCARRAPTGADLAGVAVTLVGVGHPADGQPLPSTLQLSWLSALWSDLCAGTGAKPCVVSTNPVAETSRAAPADPPTDPVVSFPPPDHGVRQADGSTRYQLDSAVLFAPNESTITSGGQLAAVAADIVATGGAVVTVDGYTEAQASPQANQELAQDRADAVRAFLAGHGVPDARATGHAGTAPGCEPRERQCQRRVDIVAAPPR